jgi:hypothetical protein
MNSKNSVKINNNPTIPKIREYSASPKTLYLPPSPLLWGGQGWEGMGVKEKIRWLSL